MSYILSVFSSLDSCIQSINQYFVTDVGIMGKKAVIVGNPNTGKSILFNKLANGYSAKRKGVYSIVANYPYTTVETLDVALKIGGEDFLLTDTPGLNSLTAISDDELLTRELLVKQQPDVVIQSLDSTKLEKSLLLTSQLMELGLPLVIVLNFTDETHKNGVWIDADTLESMLGVPVIETIANQDQGVSELAGKLKATCYPSSNRRPPTPNLESAPKYKKVINQGLEIIQESLTDQHLSQAIKLLLLTKDGDIEQWAKEQYGSDLLLNVNKSLQTLRDRSGNNFGNIILQDRALWVERIIERVIKESKISTNNLSEKIGRYSRHPLWGWPILAGAMYITYLLVGKLAANHMVGFFEESIVGPLLALLGGVISSDFLRDFLVGDYGILSTGLGNALATTMPILTMFFLILNIMEDSGYFTNLCILVSRLTRLFGLSGQSVLPLMLGFGCKTMATLSTKILDSKRERYIAIFLIGFAIPCSPQMGLILGILASYSFYGFLTVFGVLFLAEFIVGTTLDRLLKKDEGQTDFILEIPPIRFPRFKDVMQKLYYRMKWFMIEIPPLFMAGAFLLFVLDKSGALLVIKHLLTPVFVTFLSLPIETVDAFLLCLVKLEAGAVQLLSLTNDGVLTYPQIIVSLIIMTSIGPCAANLMAIIKQINLPKAVALRVTILMLSILTGGAVNWSFKLATMLGF
jgi:ferrous iron transport protein B